MCSAFWTGVLCFKCVNFVLELTNTLSAATTKFVFHHFRIIHGAAENTKTSCFWRQELQIKPKKYFFQNKKFQLYQLFINNLKLLLQIEF